jgi:hypothetical protein
VAAGRIGIALCESADGRDELRFVVAYDQATERLSYVTSGDLRTEIEMGFDDFCQAWARRTKDRSRVIELIYAAELAAIGPSKAHDSGVPTSR